MTRKPVPSGIRAALEFGPVAAFVAVYLALREQTFDLGGTEYPGLLVVTAGFIPIFLLATGALWALEGRISRLQIALAGMLVLFGGLSLWLNDPVFLKMKPTIIYLTLAALLGIGLLRGQSWLQMVLDEVIPLRKRGWMRLTRRLVVLLLLSAAANEIVWRTQSETFWVLFETLVMPIVIGVFFLAQIPLYIENASAKGMKPRERS